MLPSNTALRVRDARETRTGQASPKRTWAMGRPYRGSLCVSGPFAPKCRWPHAMANQDLPRRSSSLAQKVHSRTSHLAGIAFRRRGPPIDSVPVDPCEGRVLLTWASDRSISGRATYGSGGVPEHRDVLRRWYGRNIVCLTCQGRTCESHYRHDRRPVRVTLPGFLGLACPICVFRSSTLTWGTPYRFVKGGGKSRTTK